MINVQCTLHTVQQNVWADWLTAHAQPSAVCTTLHWSTVNCRYLEVPVNNDFTAQELGLIVTGILKQVLFQRDQMPMPYDILDCHLRSGRLVSNVERLTALRNQFSAVFDSLDRAFMDSSFLLDQIVLIFGSTRFNGKEMHAINVPYPFSKNRRVLRSHRTEEMNGTLRKILEADVFCNFPPSDITSAHLFLHGCPVDMDSNLLQFFEPLMRFTPKVAPKYYRSIFDLKFAGHGRLTKRSTFQRSGSHLNVHRKSDIEREELRMNLFMESNSAVKELEEPLKTDFAEDKDDESSDTSDNDEGTFSDLEDSLDNSDKQTTVGGPQQFIWYRSKIAVTGWVPHS